MSEQMFGARPAMQCATHGGQRFEWHEGDWRCQVCGEPPSGPLDVYALLDARDAAEARAVRCECVIRDAAHLMATRMEGTPIVESYGAAYRVLFGYLHPDAPLPKCEQAGSMVTLAARR